MEEMHHAVMAFLGAAAGFAFSYMIIGEETKDHLSNSRKQAFSPIKRRKGEDGEEHAGIVRTEHNDFSGGGEGLGVIETTPRNRTAHAP